MTTLSAGANSTSSGRALPSPPPAEHASGQRKLDLLWAGVAILLPALLVSVAPVSTVDLAYGIRAGALVLDGAGIPRVDTFTFTAAGLPWVDQQWLAQVIFAAAFRAGGWPTLATLWVVIVASIQALLWRASRSMGADARSTGVALLLGFVVAAQGIGLRAQVLGLLCLAGLLALVADRRRHPGRLWLAVPLMAVWANLHGSFPIGLVLLGLAAVEDVAARRRARIPIAVVIAAVLATLANPFGFDAWRYVAAIGTEPTIARFVVEWRHTSPFDLAGAAFYASVAAVVALVAVRSPRPGRPPLTTLAWLAGLAFLGAWAVRAIAWWGVGAAPVAAALLAGVLAWRAGSESGGNLRVTGPEPGRRAGPGRAGIAFVAALAILAVAVQPAWRPSPDGGGIGSRLVDAPAGIARAVDEATAAHPAARVFNAQRWGSWLELATPGALVFADSRVELIPASVWSDYILVSEGDARWREILDSWQVDVVVVALADQPALASLVQGDAGWRASYQDADGLVAVRSTP